MKQLGVSTSTDTLSLAVFEENQSLASVTLNSRRKHGELLLEAIHDLLKHMSWSATDLDEIYIDVGPGSYTGLRIGVTMAKTWAFANEVAIYSLSSMALQASNLIDTPRANDLVVSLMDSRRNTAYTGVYEICDGKVRERIPDQHVEWENFLEDIHDQLEDHSGVTFVGDKIDEFVEKGYPVRKVLSLVELAKSSYYYQPKDTKSGKREAKSVLDRAGNPVPLDVVLDDIKELLNQSPFCGLNFCRFYLLLFCDNFIFIFKFTDS